MSADKGADSSTENDPHSRFMHACIAWGGGINGQQALHAGEAQTAGGLRL